MLVWGFFLNLSGNQIRNLKTTAQKQKGPSFKAGRFLHITEFHTREKKKETTEGVRNVKRSREILSPTEVRGDISVAAGAGPRGRRASQAGDAVTAHRGTTPAGPPWAPSGSGPFGHAAGQRASGEAFFPAEEGGCRGPPARGRVAGVRGRSPASCLCEERAPARGDRRQSWTRKGAPRLPVPAGGICALELRGSPRSRPSRQRHRAAGAPGSLRGRLGGSARGPATPRPAARGWEAAEGGTGAAPLLPPCLMRLRVGPAGRSRGSRRRRAAPVAQSGARPQGGGREGDRRGGHAFPAGIVAEEFAGRF